MTAIQFLMSAVKSRSKSVRRLLLRYLPEKLFLAALDLTASIRAGLQIANASVYEKSYYGYEELGTTS